MSAALCSVAPAGGTKSQEGRPTMSVEDEFEDLPTDIRLCSCGCNEQEHDDHGRCCYCGPEDCGGFTYDEESSLMALVFSEDLP